MPKPERDCSHSCRSRARASRRRGGTETISLDRRANRDFPSHGAVLPPSASLCRATGFESRRRRDVQRCGLCLAPRAAGQWRRHAQASVHAGLEASRRPKARHRPHPRRGAAIRHGGADLARDRGRRPHRRGRAGDCGRRHDQAWSTAAATSRPPRSAPACGSHRRRRRFASTVILDAHRRAARDGRGDFTDDARARRMGGIDGGDL